MSKVDELIARVRKLDAAATAEPWEAEGAGGLTMDGVSDYYNIVSSDNLRVNQLSRGKNGRANAALIAEYRTLAPKLAYMLERAMAALKRIEQGEFGDWGGDVALVARAEIQAMAEGGEVP